MKALLYILLVHVYLLNAEIRIINGNEVAADEDRWQSIVYLQIGEGSSCGGTLIAPQWVLTASHCLLCEMSNEAVPESSVKVATGDYSIENPSYTGVTEIILHPDYNHSTSVHDIALLYLSKPIENITPISINKDFELQSQTESWVAGWGVYDVETQGSPMSLNEVMVPIIDLDICRGDDSYGGKDITLSDNVICAGYMEGGKDSCQGDSGGPLINQKDDKWYLSGVVSFGGGICASANFPGIYTKVKNYTKWIESYTSLDASASNFDTTKLSDGWHNIASEKSIRNIKNAKDVEVFWKYTGGAWSQEDSVSKGEAFWVKIKR